MEAKKSLELKHERTCHESKVVRDHKADLEKEVNSIKVALKTAQKDLKDTNYKSEKKIKTLEDNIEELNEDKATKLLEGKEIKNKMKKANKKFKMIEEKEAKLKIELSKLEKSKKNIADTDLTTDTRAKKDENKLFLAKSHSRFPPGFPMKF